MKSKISRCCRSTALGVSLLCSSIHLAASSQEFADPIAQYSYFYGHIAAQSLVDDSVEIDMDAFNQGLKDAFTETHAKMSAKERELALQNLRKQVEAYHEKQALAWRDKNLAFLEANKSNPDIEVLPSGLQFSIIQFGKGSTPTLEQKVRCNFTSTLINGTPADFTNGISQPVSFVFRKGLPAGLQEGLLLMNEGAKFKFFIPPHLAFGEAGHRGIRPHSTLIMEIEVVEFIDPKPVSQK